MARRHGPGKRGGGNEITGKQSHGVRAWGAQVHRALAFPGATARAPQGQGQAHPLERGSAQGDVALVPISTVPHGCSPVAFLRRPVFLSTLL